jgi:uncharacterized iron-regulated protein
VETIKDFTFNMTGTVTLNLAKSRQKHATDRWCDRRLRRAYLKRVTEFLLKVLEYTEWMCVVFEGLIMPMS